MNLAPVQEEMKQKCNKWIKVVHEVVTPKGEDGCNPRYISSNESREHDN